MKSIDYTPPPTVGSFIQHYLPGGLFYDWIIGPVGSGKTTGIFFKLVYLASLQTPSPIDGIRRSRAVVVRNTAPQLRDTTLSSWNYWFKDGVAGTWHATSPMPMMFVLRFGDVECEVLFRALDTADDVQRVLSLEVTFVVIDEFVEINQDIVEALAARAGRYPPQLHGGATNWGVWGSSNPGNEDQWWFDYLGLNEDPIPENARLWVQPPGDSPEAENLANLPGGVKYYESLKIGKSDAWVNRFIKTQWGYSIAGTPVIVTFNPQLHVAKTHLRGDPLLPLVAGFDPGLAGSALVFGQLNLKGQLNVLAELVQRDMGAERIITDRLKPLLRARFSEFEFIIAPDPAADSRSNNNEKTIVDTLRNRKKGGFTVKFPDMNNRLPLRVESIEHFTTRLIEGGLPALQIDPSCRHVIRALQGGWRYELNKRGVMAKEEPEKNAASHPGDAFGYLCRYLHHTQARGARRVEQPRQFMRTVNPYVGR